MVPATQREVVDPEAPGCHMVRIGQRLDLTQQRNPAAPGRRMPRHPNDLTHDFGSGDVDESRGPVTSSRTTTQRQRDRCRTFPRRACRAASSWDLFGESPSPAIGVVAEQRLICSRITTSWLVIAVSDYSRRQQLWTRRENVLQPGQSAASSRVLTSRLTRSPADVTPSTCSPSRCGNNAVASPRSEHRRHDGLSSTRRQSETVNHASRG